MFKIVAVIKKKPELSREEFLHHWNVEHPLYVRKLPGIRRYLQNPAIEHKKQWPYDGVAELYFDSVKDIAVAYAGVEAEELFEHEDKFLEVMEWFIAEEIEVDFTDEGK